VTITGTSGSLSATTTLTLTVDASGNFTLAASPKTLKVAQGSSGTSTITIKPTAGFDQEVTLSASGLPSGVTASIQHQSGDIHQHLDAQGERLSSGREVDDHHHRQVWEPESYDHRQAHGHLVVGLKC